MSKLVKNLQDEFEPWIRHHPNAGLFNWEVAARNVLDNSTIAQEMATRVLEFLGKPTTQENVDSLASSLFEHGITRVLNGDFDAPR